jgi:tRNA-specific 2-thiouridylase
VRKIAKSLDLVVANKHESREICFIPDNDYAKFIAGRVDQEKFKPGNIVNSEGKVLGEHKGYPAYTIGQRKSLNLGGLSEPHYVTAINAEKNEITVGVKSQLYEEEFFVSGASWYLEPESPFEAEIQIRYRHEAVMGEIERLEGGRAAVRMNVPQTAVTPGQAAVFYRDDCIIGGGWIE